MKAFGHSCGTSGHNQWLKKGNKVRAGLEMTKGSVNFHS